MELDPRHGRCHVALTVYRGEQRLAWGDLLVTPAEGCTVLGKLYDIELRPPGQEQPLSVQVTAGVVIDHHTDSDGAMLLLRLYDLVDTGDEAEPSRQVLVFKSATRIPADYESEREDSLGEVEGYEVLIRVKWLDRLS
jgi:hypothetical protein